MVNLLPTSLDPEIIAEGHQFLPHSVAGGCAAPTKNLALFAPLFASSFA
jgi:hypothetical protein